MKQLDAYWYQTGVITFLLLPLSWLFCSVVVIRRALYRIGVLSQTRVPVPVIVVGNINVGGTGKTPLVIKLVENLRAQGYHPGIISRGYGGWATRESAKHEVITVTADSDPAVMGDEPVLLAQRCRCPLRISASRVSAAQRLLNDTDCNVIISDDGLQHYALQRDVEIVVLDGERRLGNGHCLPAGPLREAAGRLRSVDFVVCNGEALQGEYAMQLQPGDACRVDDVTQSRPVASFGGSAVHALAGIGNPGRFFQQLREAGLEVTEHAFPDHYAYQPQDIIFKDDLPVLMTEKDAIKCHTFATARHWFVPVTTQCDEGLLAGIVKLLKDRVTDSDAINR